jgi:hypothetical protein
MIHSSTLEFSSRLPVSVYGTGLYYLKLRGFSWKQDYSHIHAAEALWYFPHSAFETDLPISNIPTVLNVLFRQYADLSLLRHPIAVI